MKHLLQRPLMLVIPLFVAVQIVSVQTSAVPAADWSVPMAGNAFRSAPGPGGNGLQRNGSIIWSDAAGVFSVYFHADRSAELSLAVNARVQAGQATLESRIGQKKFQTVIADA
ncbi:MAG: DUF5077 domain-containing protein, partial [Planctomycetaceae bacterium]